MSEKDTQKVLELISSRIPTWQQRYDEVETEAEAFLNSLDRRLYAKIVRYFYSRICIFNAKSLLERLPLKEKHNES